MSGLGIYIVLVIIIVFFVIYEYNFCTRLRNKCYQSKSSIDVFLTQRFDLIPNLEQVVKGYVKHEKDVLVEITKLRTEFEKNGDISVANELNSKMSELLVLVENNPQLKSSELFVNFQRELADVEDEIQAVRRIYNSSVTKFNTKIKQVPYNFFNAILKYKEEEYDKNTLEEKLEAVFLEVLKAGIKH